MVVLTIRARAYMLRRPVCRGACANSKGGMIRSSWFGHIIILLRAVMSSEWVFNDELIRF